MKARFATLFFLGVLVMLPLILGANEKSCVLVCIDGQTQCSGSEIQTCQNGAWANTTDCSATGNICQNGKCVVGCQTATDCTGPLPQVCQVCNDGSNGCAHWTCSGGKCEIAYCMCEPIPCPQDEIWDSAQCKCGPICSNGTVGTGMCCLSVGDFPSTCPVTTCVCPAGQVCNCPAMIEACGCSSDNSHQVKVCNCPPNMCFDGTKCVVPAGCTNGQTQCSGNEVQTCQIGAWVNTTDCSATGNICQNGQCVVGCQTAADCTGPLPDLCMVCPGGGSGCAHWTCASGKCTIVYCSCKPLPCPLGATWDSVQCACLPGCTTPADCKGALPQLCMLCSDGSNGCAHFICTAGTCQIAYCP